jgi:hypothetical protein
VNTLNRCFREVLLALQQKEKNFSNHRTEEVFLRKPKEREHIMSLPEVWSNQA